MQTYFGSLSVPTVAHILCVPCSSKAEDEVVELNYHRKRLKVERES